MNNLVNPFTGLELNLTSTGIVLHTKAIDKIIIYKAGLPSFIFNSIGTGEFNNLFIYGRIAHTSKPAMHIQKPTNMNDSMKLLKIVLIRPSPSNSLKYISFALFPFKAVLRLI